MRTLKTKTLILILFAALILTVPVLGQGSNPPTLQPLILTDEQGDYSLGRSVDILEDPGGELTIDDVTSPEYASRFTPSTADVPNFAYTSSAFWLRLHLRNESSLINQWLLEVNYPNLNYVDLYIPSQAGGYTVKESGVLRPFNTRDIQYYHVVFELPLAQQDEQIFYVRVLSGSSMTLGFTLWSPEAFAENKISDMLRMGLFFGALLIMLGYHLFVYYLLRESIYLYFILMLAGAILFFSAYEGVADQYLWPGWSQYKVIPFIFGMSVFFIFSLIFSNIVFEQKTRTPRIYLLFNVIIGFWVLMMAIVPFSSWGFMAQITAPFIFITPLIVLLAGVYHWINRYQPARFYVVSWLGFLLGLMSAELVRSDIIPSTPITENFYHIGLVWLVLLWSLALANRINLLKNETEQVNRKLLQSRSEMSQTLEGLPIGVVVYGTDRRVTYANQRAVNLLSNLERGIQADVSTRRTLEEAMKYFSFRIAGSNQDYPVEKMPIAQAFDGKSAVADDIEANLIDRRVPLEFWANPVIGQGGDIESVVAAFQDITQRKEGEAELEQYRYRLEELVNQRTEELSTTNELLQVENAERRRLEDMLRRRIEWMVAINHVYQTVTSASDLPQIYKTFTDRIKYLFGASDAFIADFDNRSMEIRLLAHSCQSEAHPDLAGIMIEFPASALFERLIKRIEPVILSREIFSNLDGVAGTHYKHTKSQIVMLEPLHNKENIIGLLGLEFLEAERLFSVDEITLIEKIGFDILQVREKVRLAEQTQMLIAVEERNRLARDLHDSVTQVLFAASLVAEVLPDIWRRDPEVAQASLEELRHLTRAALSEMRTMLLELRPAAIVKTPLSDLLAQLTEAVTSRNNVPFQLFLERTPPLPEEVHVCFYRVAQESLNNAIKHAHANLVSVSLGITAGQSEPTEDWHGEVELMVRDNGRGFYVEKAGTHTLGLGIMRERAAVIGAVLSIESQDQHGTTVTLTWEN